MKLLHRRQFLDRAAGAAALPIASRLAHAQTYPSRPVRFIAGFAAGGAVDIVARLMGQWLSDRLGQPVVIENRPGAGGNIAVDAAVNSAPDGYTLLFVGVNNAISATYYDNLKFNFIRDIAPVAGIMRLPNIMEVGPSVPAATVPEFIAYAKANPGKLSYASPGGGTSPHMSAELFRALAQIDLVDVPYNRGMATGAYADLMTGKVHMAFDNLPGSIELIRAGKLRALAVTTMSRSALLTNVPTVSEFVPGYEASAWYGIGVPNGTPTEIVDRLNKEVNAGLADAILRARLVDMGGMLLPGSPIDLAKLIGEETEKWAKVIRMVNIRSE